MLRRPVVGEVIHFQLHIGEDGNSKAIVARIAELAFLKTRKSLTNKQNKPQTRWILLLVGILFFVAIIFVFNGKFRHYHVKESDRTTELIAGIADSNHDLILKMQLTMY